MSNRKFFHAYLDAQAVHKVLHKALRAFEEGASDAEIQRLLINAIVKIQNAKDGVDAQ